MEERFSDGARGRRWMRERNRQDTKGANLGVLGVLGVLAVRFSSAASLAREILILRIHTQNRLADLEEHAFLLILR
jgi:hypothetical protein